MRSTRLHPSGARAGLTAATPPTPSRRRRLGAASVLLLALFALAGCGLFPQGDYDDLVAMRTHVLGVVEHDTFALIDQVGGTLAFAEERESPSGLGFGSLPDVYYWVTTDILPAPGSAAPTDADLEQALADLGYTVEPSEDPEGDFSTIPVIAFASATSADGATAVLLRFIEEYTAPDTDGTVLTIAAHYRLEVQTLDRFKVPTDDYRRFRDLVLVDDAAWVPAESLLITP